MHSYKNKQTTVIGASGGGVSGSFTNETTREYSYEFTTVERHCDGYEPNPVDKCGHVTSQSCGECIQHYQNALNASKPYRRFWSFFELACFPEELRVAGYDEGQVKAAKCSRETGKATNGPAPSPEECGD